jgi:TusA-related sulfurtransferase
MKRLFKASSNSKNSEFSSDDENEINTNQTKSFNQVQNEIVNSSDFKKFKFSSNIVTNNTNAKKSYSDNISSNRSIRNSNYISSIISSSDSSDNSDNDINDNFIPSNISSVASSSNLTSKSNDNNNISSGQFINISSDSSDSESSYKSDIKSSNDYEIKSSNNNVNESSYKSGSKSSDNIGNKSSIKNVNESSYNNGIKSINNYEIKSSYNSVNESSSKSIGNESINNYSNESSDKSSNESSDESDSESSNGEIEYASDNIEIDSESESESDKDNQNEPTTNENSNTQLIKIPRGMEKLQFLQKLKIIAARKSNSDSCNTYILEFPSSNEYYKASYNYLKEKGLNSVLQKYYRNKNKLAEPNLPQLNKIQNLNILIDNVEHTNTIQHFPQEKHVKINQIISNPFVKKFQLNNSPELIFFSKKIQFNLPNLNTIKNDFITINFNSSLFTNYEKKSKFIISKHTQKQNFNQYHAFKKKIQDLKKKSNKEWPFKSIKKNDLNNRDYLSFDFWSNKFPLLNNIVNNAVFSNEDNVHRKKQKKNPNEKIHAEDKLTVNISIFFSYLLLYKNIEIENIEQLFYNTDHINDYINFIKEGYDNPSTIRRKIKSIISILIYFQNRTTIQRKKFKISNARSILSNMSKQYRRTQIKHEDYRKNINIMKQEGRFVTLEKLHHHLSLVNIHMKMSIDFYLKKGIVPFKQKLPINYLMFIQGCFFQLLIFLTSRQRSEVYCQLKVNDLIFIHCDSSAPTVSSDSISFWENKTLEQIINSPTHFIQPVLTITSKEKVTRDLFNRLWSLGESFTPYVWFFKKVIRNSILSRTKKNHNYLFVNTQGNQNKNLNFITREITFHSTGTSLSNRELRVLISAFMKERVDTATFLQLCHLQNHSIEIANVYYSFRDHVQTTDKNGSHALQSFNSILNQRQNQSSYHTETQIDQKIINYLKNEKPSLYNSLKKQIQ